MRKTHSSDGAPLVPERRDERRLAIIVIAAIGPLLAAGYFAAGPMLNLAAGPSPQAAKLTTAPAAAKIVTAPTEGGCRQLLMDNQTGRFSEFRTLPCEDAATPQ